MDNFSEKESSEITLINSYLKYISEIEDPLWVFTGKPFNKPQNNDMPRSELVKNQSILNLSKLKDSELMQISDNIDHETLELENFNIDYPYSSVGIISIKYSDCTYAIGCGTLIMPGVVITCANIISNEHKEISTIKFLCNFDEIKSQFKYEIEVIKHFFPKNFKNGYQLEDYAILILNKPIGKNTGFLGIIPFSNLDNNTSYNFCTFDILNNKNIIHYLEEKKSKRIEYRENEGNSLKDKATIDRVSNLVNPDTHCNKKNELSHNKLSFLSNFSYFKFKEKYDSFNLNTESYFMPEIFEGELRIKENEILHKHKKFSKIPGCPIFIDKDNLSNFYLFEESMKNKNNSIFNVVELNNNNSSNLNKSMITMNEKNVVNNNNLKEQQKIPAIYERPEFYLVGICTGKFDNIFNKATLICRKRFEKIKKWIRKYSIDSGKIQKQRILNLESNYLDDLFMENIPKVDLNDLTHLLLRNNSIRLDGVSFLSKSNFKYLNELDLSNNDIKETGVQIICESNIFKNLEILKLASNNISRLGTNYIANSKIISLKHLDLACNNIRADGILNLFSGKNKSVLAQLNYLNLANNKIFNQGIINLSNSRLEYVKSIRHLNLSQNKITNKGFIYFTKSNNFFNLLSLNISQNNISNEGVKEFANGQFGYLKELNISENKIGDEGVSFIAYGKLFSLNNLILESCEISDFGLFNISKGNFPYLETLNMKNNKIGDRGAGFLIETNFTFLKNINLEKNKIGSDGRITLSRLIQCNIIIDKS